VKKEMSKENLFYPLSEERVEDQQKKKGKREGRIEWLLPLGRKLWAENLFPSQIISDLAREAQDLFNVSEETAREYAHAAYRLLQAEASRPQL
jgi:hypothetical protein